MEIRNLPKSPEEVNDRRSDQREGQRMIVGNWDGDGPSSRTANKRALIFSLQNALKAFVNNDEGRPTNLYKKGEEAGRQPKLVLGVRCTTQG